MSRPARVLSICREGGALATRNEILRLGGYAVTTATDVGDALATIDRQAFDLVIIGQRFDVAEKNLIATEARRAGLKVLCMHSESQPPEVHAANAFIHNLDGPEQLLSAVAALTERAASA